MLFLNAKTHLLKITLGWFLIVGPLTPQAFATENTNENIRETVHALNTEYIKFRPDAAAKDAIEWYTSNGFEFANGHLRGDPYASQSLLERICQLDQIFATNLIHKLKGITTYRGHQYLPPGSDQVGFQFNNKGYASTSILREIAMKFTINEDDDGDETRVLDIIHVPTDLIPALWLNTFSSTKKEYEVLLPRGVQFEVIDVKIEKSFWGTPLTVRTLKALGIRRDSKFEGSLGCRH